MNYRRTKTSWRNSIRKINKKKTFLFLKLFSRLIQCRSFSKTSWFIRNDMEFVVRSDKLAVLSTLTKGNFSVCGLERHRKAKEKHDRKRKKNALNNLSTESLWRHSSPLFAIHNIQKIAPRFRKLDERKISPLFYPPISFPQ